MKRLLICCLFIVNISNLKGQNAKIKCYFNKPVNNGIATVSNAIYLNGTFPDTIAAYIDRAKFTLDIAVYNTTSNGTDIIKTKILTAINNAYNRGVIVRWVFDSSSSNTGLQYLNSSIPRIGSPTSSSYGIMHNKFIAIDVNSLNADDAFLISGSYNFSVQQTNTDYNNIIIIQNKDVATAYYNEFNKFWGGTGTTPNFAASTFGKYKTTSAAHYFNVNGTQVQIHFSPKDTCAKYLKNLIASADNDLTFGIYTFTDNSIATPILNKFNAGVKVRGIMDNFSQTYTPFTTLSTPLGANMVNYAGTGIYHNKVMIADALMGSSDAQVQTGSFNWSTSAQTVNDENILIIHDSVITNQFYQSLCKNISDNGGTPCIVPLPIEWVEFSAKIGFNSVILNWQTSIEINNDHFEIERSADGVRFERIGVIKANNLNNGSKYEFEDKQCNEGTNYYRIKQVDFDGAGVYSKIVSVYNKTENKVRIYPNPASDFINVEFPKGCEEINIYTIYGVCIMSTAVRGLGSVRMNLQGLGNGVYWVKVLNQQTKLIKY